MHPEILLLPLWAQKDLTTAESSVPDGQERQSDTETLRNSVQCHLVMVLNRKNKHVQLIWSFADTLLAVGWTRIA